MSSLPAFGKRGEVERKTNKGQREWLKWEQQFNGIGKRKGMAYATASDEIRAYRRRWRKQKENGNE